MTTTKTKRARVRNVAGFWRGGLFHPIRKDAEKYNEFLAGDFDTPAERRERKKANEKKAAVNYEKQLENEIRREMFGSNEQKTAGQTLLQFVRSAGGFKRTRYDRGELAFLEFRQSGKRGLVSNTKGKTLEKMFQSALESGFDLNSSDEMLSRLEDEIKGGAKFYASHGFIDYRRNPAMKKTTKRTTKRGAAAPASAAEIRRTAKTLAALFPNSTASAVIKKLKRNPAASKAASAAISAFDVNDDGDVDRGDVKALKAAAAGNLAMVDGAPALLVSATSGGDVLIDRLDARGLDIVPADSVSQLPPADDRAKNPAAVRRIGNKYRVVLPNGSYLKIRGRLFESTTRRAADDLARRLTFRPAVELAQLSKLSMKRNPKKAASAAKRKTARKNPAWLSNFANAAVGIASALQIKEAVAKKKKRPAARKNPAPRVRRVNADNSSCPKCGQYNAMLPDYKNGQRVEVCRNCGYVKGAAKNPAKYKRPAFEEFQGRPATKFESLPVSVHAPASLDQIGRLVEIKLVGEAPISFEHRKQNPFVLAMTPKARKLWIAGGPFSRRKNPALAANEIEVLGEIEHVVYEAYKPHIEDATREYIHELGEETGERPELGLDAAGFPVIIGGAYNVEARGIVN